MNKPLGRAFSSSPFIPPRYVLYCNNAMNNQLLVVSAVSMYAARKLVEEITGEANPEVIKDLFDDGTIRVRCDELADIVKYKYTDAERDWVLPTPYDSQIAYFRNAPKRDPNAPTTGKNRAAAISVAQKAEGGSVTGVMTTEGMGDRKVRAAPARPAAVDDVGQKVVDLTSKDGQFDRDALIRFAKTNGVWKDGDDKLSNGLARMSVVNRLRGKIKRGEQVAW